MKQPKFSLFTLLFLSMVSLQAQTTTGKEFWVTFVEHYHYTADPSFQIRIVSYDAPASGTIYFNNLGTSVTFNIPAKQIFTHTLTASQKQAALNTIMGINDHSVHITSNVPVSVYAIMQREANTEMTHILPLAALGTNYYQISYTPFNTIDDHKDTFTIIATEDDTKIYQDLGLVATLNAGQVYYKTYSTDMTGANITATKPVALFASIKAACIPEGAVGSDCLFEQLSPVNAWGKNFFVPVSHDNYNRVRIMVAHDHTNIVQTGGVLKSATGSQMNLTNLKAGQFVELEVYLQNNGCFIEADQPVGVCTYMTSYTYNQVNSGDPSQVWLPPIDQTIPDALMAPFIPTGISLLNAHYALLVTPSDTKDNTKVSIGGAPAAPLSGGIWRNNLQAGMSFYAMKLSNSNITYHFTNPAGLIVMGYGIGDWESYYYLVGASMKKLTAEFYANDIHYQSLQDHVFCTEDIEFRAEITEMSDETGSLRWFIDGVEEPSAVDQIKWSKSFQPGEYEITMWARSKDDTITLGAPLKIAAVITTSVNPPEGGNVEGDSCYLKGETAHLVAKPNSGYEFVNWTRSGVEVSVDNPYSFTVTQSVALVANFLKGCFHFDNYATILWNNTFILNLNKIAADGYELIDCKWYRNGVEEHKSSTINHYSYSAGPHKTDLLELAPTYYTYELITKNEGALCSTPKILTQYVDYGSGKMSVYPNPVYSGVALTIAGIKKGELLQVYNQYGACVYNAMVHDTTMKLTLHLSSGLYLVRAGDSITKILVLE